MKTNQKGFSVLIAVLVVLALVVAVAGAYVYFYVEPPAAEQRPLPIVQNTQEAAVNQLPRQPVEQNPPVNQLSVQPGAIDASSWRNYRNEKYGFEFKYPNTWIVDESNDAAAVMPKKLNNFVQIKISNGAKGPEDESQSICQPGTGVIGGQIGKSRVDGTGKAHDELSFAKFVDFIIKNPERGTAPANMPTLTPTNFGGLAALRVDGKTGNCVTALYYIDQGASGYGTISTVADKNEDKLIIDKIISSFKFVEMGTVINDSKYALWETYRDQEHGFEFRYPEIFLPRGVENGINLEGCNAGNINQKIPCKAPVVFYADGKKYWQCKYRDGAAGTVYETYLYIGIADNGCLSFKFTVPFTNCGVYGSPQDIAYQKCEKSSQEALKTIEEIKETFKFVK